MPDIDAENTISQVTNDRVSNQHSPTSMFISYRRDGFKPYALLLKYELEKHLQFVRVFLDVEDIKPGDEFPDEIGRSIEQSDIVFALIGPSWMPPKGTGQPMREGLDWVEAELRLALESGKFVMPLRFSENVTFNSFDIPASINKIRELQFTTLQHESWSSSVEQLIQRLIEKFKLRRHSTENIYPTAKPAKGRTQPLDDTMIHQILKYEDLAGWYVDSFGDLNKRCIVKEFHFENFDRAFEFMEAVAGFCKVIEHHPIWDNLYNNVKIVLSTFDAEERVTFYDVSLALFINKEYERQTGKLI